MPEALPAVPAAVQQPQEPPRAGAAENGPLGGGEKKRSARSPREDLGLTDRIFLAIENPVLRRELLTALRSYKAFILQFLYLAILGAIVWLAWPTEQITSRDALTRTLFHTFGMSQLVLLSIMAPAFAASAMTIEKERRCIDLLMTSPIRPGTILMGKYMSSVVYLFLTLVSTAPVIAVVMWLPGLGPLEIAGLYILLFSVAAAFGMVGLTCSVFFARSQTSLSITYMLVLPMALILFACAAAWDGFFLIEAAIWPSAFLLVMAFIMYQACLARMRKPFEPVFKAADEEDVSAQTGLVIARDRFPDNLLSPPNAGELLPDGVNPIYQKELRSEIFGRGTLFLRLLIQISMFLSVVFLGAVFVSREYYFVDYLVIFTMLVAPAFACNTFTQERERGTLDLLLTTLIRPSQIISGKFLSCLRLSVFLTGLVGLTLCFHVFIGSNPMAHRALGFAIYWALLFVTIVFEISLAMFFSLLLNNTVRSMITTYMTLLLLFGAPLAAGVLLEVFTKLKHADFFWAVFCSPFYAVHSVPAWFAGQEQNAAENLNVWPYYLIFAGASSVLLMGYVFAAFKSKALKASNTK